MLTLVCTTLAGSELVTNKSILDPANYSFNTFLAGFSYSIPFLLILTVHEFGHFFMAKYHKVEVTLPNYIPGYIPGILWIGTFGALIKIVSPIRSRKHYFDIGIAGPLAGFVVALGVLFYGFTHLPEPEYIFEIHPEYAEYGLDYEQHVYADTDVPNMQIGNSILFSFFEQYVGDPEKLPNHRELMHYPFLFAGFLSLFFTALNLIPIGQLDGGHILYGILGIKIHERVARILFLVLAFIAGLGLVGIQTPQSDLLLYSIAYVGFLYFCFIGLGLSKINTLLAAVAMFVSQFLVSILLPDLTGFTGYLVFVLLLGRFIGIKHPKTIDERPLSSGRKALGWIALIIFILCFSINPISIA